MKLIVKCKNCRTPINLKGSFSDRSELSNKKGKAFNLQCPECLKDLKYHSNEVSAKESKQIKIFAFLIYIIGTGFMAYFLKDFIFESENPYIIYIFGLIILMPSIVFVNINKQQREKIRRFNRY